MSLLGPLLENVLAHPAFRAARDKAAQGPGEVSLAGLTRTAKALALAGLARERSRPVIVLTRDNEIADELRRTSATFLTWLDRESPAEAVSVLEAPDVSPYERRSPHPEISERRAVALWRLSRGQTRVLLAPATAALGRFRERAFYASLAVEIKLGDELDLGDLAAHLASVGYEPAEPVREVGQYSQRGGIIDVFPPEAEWPFRIEFFGDRVESLREFDPDTQRSRHPAGRTLLLPLSEASRTPAFFDKLVRRLTERAAQAARHPRRPEKEPDWAPLFSGPFPGWEFYPPLVEPHPNTLFSLFERPLVVWDEPVELRKYLTGIFEDWMARFNEVRDVEPPPPRPEEILLTMEEFAAAVAPLSQLCLKELGLEPSSSSAEFHLPSQPATKFHGDVKNLAESLRARKETTLLVLPTEGKLERVREILQEYALSYSSLEPAPTTQEKPPGDPAAQGSTASPEGPVLLARGEVGEGVVFPEARFALLSDAEIFGGFAWGAGGRPSKSGITSFLSDLSDLKVGDYVVHVDHGIGMYQGLKQLGVSGTPRDFMLLTYQDDARLYVPLERLDLVEKYRGGDGAKPPLDRLGGTSWVRTKTRVKRALRDMAEELLRLYAERKMKGSVACGADTPWQKEFEAAFEFEETPDQLTALADIKRDLESPEPMDRLLCGDVGYGKTELAMRAAFKVVQEGRQVAVLAPTTVLAFQHYTTFRQRMAAFPFRIEMLSRFRTAAEQKRVVEETEAGRVDVLIGTHRLLSRDVKFRDLGMLIVDEEQRFGVAAKEKLKKLKASVEVLTMSATPIPRTLHMAVGGLRDLSVIETPPKGRLAIQTVVAPFGDALIQSAILQEMSRGGQVYFVHNRVESIFTMAAIIQRLVPTARLGVAHGQMGEKELERVMLKFIEGSYDVLVATSLIENGLDIPRANTLIVNHADRFGLADLYQLRGRVGRSNRRAYAYFLVGSEDALTPTARRRLAALKEFSDLGAGFRLAALDLELRGAGNVLGAEQSGHLNAIGIDLYLKLLEQTVEELRGHPARPEVRTTLNLGLDIKIPNEYIADESQRLRMYKRISSLPDAAARAELEAELTDRYGPIPAPVENLLRYAELKAAAESLLVQTVERKGDEVWVRFDERTPVDSTRLSRWVRAHRDASLRPGGLLRFRVRAADGDLPGEIANVLREIHA